MGYVDDVKRSLLQRKHHSSDVVRLNQVVLKVIEASVSSIDFQDFLQFLEENDVKVVQGQWQ